MRQIHVVGCGKTDRGSAHSECRSKARMHRRAAASWLLFLCCISNISNSREFFAVKPILYGYVSMQDGLHDIRVQKMSPPRVPVRIATCMSEGWMFTSAKGYQGGERPGREMSVLALPFGDVVVPGEKHSLVLSRTADQLLMRRAFANSEPVAYTVGVASTFRSSANHQGFIAGTVATAFQIVKLSEQRPDKRNGFTCECRAIGRVQLKAVKKMHPCLIASVEEFNDQPLTKEQWDKYEEIQGRVLALCSECQQLYNLIQEKSLASRLSTLESQSMLLSISEEYHLELMKSLRKKIETEPSSVAGIYKAGKMFGECGLEEKVEAALQWQKVESDDTRLHAGALLSFLACRSAGLSNDQLKGALSGDILMNRLLLALENLEIQRDKLCAVSALTGLG